MSPKAKKVLTFILVALIGLVVGVAVSFYGLLRLSVPVTDGEIQLPGLESTVEITFDQMGIPQIWAQSEADAYYALGYQHAADRIFQMDLSRRVASGRLSEMLGAVTRDIDIEQRRIGHARMARRATATLSEHNRLILQAYVDGVNAYADHCRALPFEYRFLPISFEPWTVEDCLALLSFQTWFSNALMNQDEFYVRLAEKVGREKALSLLFPYPDWAPATVGSGERAEETSRPLPRSALGRAGTVPRARLTSEQDPARYPSETFRDALARRLLKAGTGGFLMSHSSNAWVVSPQKSMSGSAMLAADPHLELTRLPQFWYAAGLHVKQDSSGVLGISTPGLPFFIMGHNGKAAWAFTAGGIDVNDYYLVQVNPDDSNRYLTPDGWRDFELVEDSMKVAGEDSLLHLTFRASPNGPIVSSGPEENQAYAVRWVGYDTDLNLAVASALELHGVDSFERFRMLVTSFGALDANMFYADVHGDIGYQLTTPLPVRPPEYGSAALPAATTSRWAGYRDIENTPHAGNPADGWLASCNNLPQRSDFVRGHFFANRIVSIDNLLRSKDRFTPEDFARFQMDRTDRYLLRFAGELARLLDFLGETEAAALMRGWDGSCGVDSRPAALMNVFLAELKTATFEDELGRMAVQVPSKWIEQIGRVDSAGWFDDVSTEDEVETYEDIAINAVEETLGAVNDKTWGEMQSLTMEHPLSMFPLLGSLLNLKLGPYPWGGDAGTLNASFSREVGEGKFESVAGPSWRFVMDFADIDAATMVLPAGNSGNPMTDHFMDFFEMWKSGERWTVPFHYEKVKEKAVSTLSLVPDRTEDAPLGP
ncbi:MAG: penicillin acylase family protein [Candidatus Zixiibacteriota bacterium]|nr:MAG: penicillin acylase family protein [candidate division Zixibacteria bacterium]